MKMPYLKALVFILVLALACGLSFAAVSAAGHHLYPCCKSPCKMNAKCHTDANVCLCKHYVAQAFLPVPVVSFDLVIIGSLAQIPSSTYLYFSNKDIFHPPRG